MTTRGDVALLTHVLARTGNRCAKCGRQIDAESAKLVEVPVRYQPPLRPRIVGRTEPRCPGCVSRYRLRR